MAAGDGCAAAHSACLRALLSTAALPRLQRVASTSRATGSLTLPAFQKRRPGMEATGFVVISDEEAVAIGHRIWHNECGGTVQGLTTWNNGEEFASFGIGHCIWYPAGMRGPFKESFPKLLNFLKEEVGLPLPVWLADDPLHASCPWGSKQEFDAAQASPQMLELRTLLSVTVQEQCHFLSRRFQKALPKLLDRLPAQKRSAVAHRFCQVATEPMGLYPLMDYVNFKSEGTRESEKYKGEGWGLLQVLENMEDCHTSGCQSAKQAFVTSAKKVLQRRVKNSPSERREKRWLAGWFKRLDTYLPKLDNPKHA